MVVATGEDRSTAPSPPEPAAVALRRFAIRWGVVFALILVAFAGTVVALNATLYSAHGFVGSYLSALARHDVDAALATPGVQVPDAASRELLAPDALGELTDIRLVSDTDEGDGRHRVVFAFDLAGSEGRSEFDVRYAGPRLGFFSSWSFDASPTGTLEVIPVNDEEFDANGLTIESEGGASAAVGYGVLVPGVFTLSHTSTFFEADREKVLVLKPAETVVAEVDTRANEDFVELVQTQLDELLDECATQEVLKPTGCPFGTTITNRIEGTPEWSIAASPPITIVPGTEPGTWQVPETEGAAHLEVDVRSLFDGSLSRFDEDVAFSVAYLITFDENDRVTITAQ